MFKTLYNLNDRKKNNLLVNTIKSAFSDLKNEIKKMPEDEIKIEKPSEIVDIVEEMKTFDYLMVLILLQTLKNILNVSSRNTKL